MGIWHEIARLPKWYERDMTCVSAEYSLDGDTLQITNRGWRDGEMKISTAVGHFVGPSDDGVFRISFFRPFYGDHPDRASRHARQDGVRLGLRRLEARVSRT